MLPGVKVVGGAICWTSGMAIDADGAPNAYAPLGKLAPLDFLANAGRPGSWWALVCDPLGNPYVQGPDDPCPGYYVSETALQDDTKPTRDPHRYVDAGQVPYVVVPPDLLAMGVKVGDLAWVTCGQSASAAIVGDVGPRGHLGEGSIALARALGLPCSPRAKNAGAVGGVSWVVFPGSRIAPPWPRDFAADAAALYQAWPGVCT